MTISGVSVDVEVFDNINKLVRDDLEQSLQAGSQVSIAAACFSFYAYQELKEQLDGIEELRFIFTSPTFVAEKADKQKREFYIPRLNRERSLYGTEFEVKLRNELTQKAIAKECAEWIRAKASFKSNITNESMSGFLTVDSQKESATYVPINGFTTVDLGVERGNLGYNMVNKLGASASTEYLKLFDNLWNDKTKLQDVTEEVLANITTAYSENSPELIYFVTLYNIFNEFLEDISEDILPNEATGFKKSQIWNKLFDFQRDAALAIIHKLEQYNGCILADSVGLGKTFTALAVIKYYETRNKTVLVLCPKKLSENWNTFKDNYVNNPIAKDRINYDVLYHTDLSRKNGFSNGLDLSRLNWANYDLIVIDESHNFRNGGDYSNDDEGRENRYLRLLNQVIRKGVKTKVLMLSATPVNNRFNDLKNQLALAYEGQAEQIDAKLKTTKGLDEIFRQAQYTFSAWSKLSPAERTTTKLLAMLDFDFFEVLDSVTIARSRKHIERHYDAEAVGRFPERLKPLSLRPSLTNLESAINYNQIYEQLTLLNLEIYTPSTYIFPSKLDTYLAQSGRELGESFFKGREEGIRRLTSINLLKRLESSVYAFSMTLARIMKLIQDTVAAIDAFELYGGAPLDLAEIDPDVDEFDLDDQNTDFFTVGKKVKIDLADMDWKSWREQLKLDIDTLELLSLMVADITPEHDNKLQELLKLVASKMKHPINEANHKVLIFSAFADTAHYLYKNINNFAKESYGLNTAMVTGSVDGRTTLPRFKASLNNVLTCFSPESKEKYLLMPDEPREIDILIATDCISEGQNLQDCDYVINYDIHWNPVRIIQRFGRIDRIGSKNAVIQLVNFWPDIDLDEYINLKDRVETRMRIAVATSTGDDDLVNPEERGDLAYRKAQLERLQSEVIDLEDMGSGISIMDLGLNEFRLDLLEYVNNNGNLDHAPFGMSAVAPSSSDAPAGVLFVLKNINTGINIDRLNQLHPFYMVYLDSQGTIVYNHLSPKEMLDNMRLICRGKSEPLYELAKAFNDETNDGKDMGAISHLLGEAIASIVEVKRQSDIDSLFSAGGTTALQCELKGLDDFELICFLVVR